MEKNSDNLLVSLFDLNGIISQPYRENEWDVIQIDIQKGDDLMNIQYHYWEAISRMGYKKIIVIAAMPCTDYALSGARHFAEKDKDRRTEASNKLLDKVKECIEILNPFAWQLENPKSRIHKLNPWLGQRPVQVFNPCDFAGYSPDPEKDRYNKETWLFGKFNSMTPKRIEPIYKENPGWKNLGGKSIETKNARSITPLGFAYAFYHANN